MSMRKVRSDKGTPRGPYRRKQVIVQAVKKRTITLPTSTHVDMDSLYLSERQYIDKAQELASKGDATYGHLPHRWETKGEFFHRVVMDWMTTRRLDVDNFREVLPQAEHRAQSTVDFETPTHLIRTPSAYSQEPTEDSSHPVEDDTDTTPSVWAVLEYAETCVLEGYVGIDQTDIPVEEWDSVEMTYEPTQQLTYFALKGTMDFLQALPPKGLQQ